MLTEGFVSLTALIAACALEPGDYFKINTEKAKYELLVQDAKAKHQWDLRPVEFDKLKEEAGVKEDLSGRTAGAVTLALGMAKILADLPGMRALMSYLYHFVIMFEALFILTLLETGTRVARFIFQETLTQFKTVQPDQPARRETSWTLNVIVSVVVSFLWGYLLYTGDIDRLWRMMGIANQMLAAIGLAVGTTYILKHSPKRAYALCTGIPFVFVVGTVFTAGVESVRLWWNQASAPDLPATDVFSYQLMCILASVIIVLGGLIVIESLRRWYLLLAGGAPRESAEMAGEEIV
jgi:carbon starvation protein